MSMRLSGAALILAFGCAAANAAMRCIANIARAECNSKSWLDALKPTGSGLIAEPKRARGMTSPMSDDRIYEVRHLAYELWDRAGRPDGQHLRFWTEAERLFLSIDDLKSKDIELASEAPLDLDMIGMVGEKAARRIKSMRRESDGIGDMARAISKES